ncbi:hypothetical protein [Xenorhabdus bovienii]|nr:hypothetical protein [Xenorhabdus bovienii]
MSGECLESIKARTQKEGEESFARWLMQFFQACEAMKTLKEKLEEEQKEVSQRLLSHDEKSQRLASQQQQLEDEKHALKLARDGVEQEKVSIVSKRAELTEKERVMNEREINAQFGFAEQNALTMRQLEKHQAQQLSQHQEQLQTLLSEKRQLEEERHRASSELDAIKYRCTEAEAERVRALDLREQDIEQRIKAVDCEKVRLKRWEKELDAEKNDIQKRVSDEIERELGRHSSEVSRMQRKLQKAYDDYDLLKNEHADFQDLKHAMGNTPVAAVLERLERFQAENNELIRKQQSSDMDELLREKDALSKSKYNLERQCYALRVELDETKRELSGKRVAATELQGIALEKRTLEYHKNALELQINELANSIEHLSNAQKTQTPFPAMSLMDSDTQYRARTELETVDDLNQFATELQHRIAQAEEHVELFYPLEEIQVLLGGLAMSQLHIFQGISGTGKTSLAKAFAKAMGG